MTREPGEGLQSRAADGRACDRGDHREIHRPAQAVIVHQQSLDTAPDDVWLDAAARGFDFRKFGHWLEVQALAGITCRQFGRL